MYRPALTKEANNLDADLNLPPAKAPVTYEDLRRKNREKFAGRFPDYDNQVRPQQQSQPPQPAQPQYGTIFDDPPPARRPVFEDNGQRTPESKNKYGDAWSQ